MTARAPLLPSRLALLIGVLLLWPALPAWGQAPCPFAPDDAVADTLDPAGYYPLQIGIVREYVTRSGPFLETLSRREVVADTLIGGDLFRKIEVLSFDAARTTIITRVDTSYAYLGVVDGRLLRWTPPESRAEVAQLFHDFYTCYSIGVEENDAVVEGHYGTAYIFQDGGMKALAATKDFVFFGLATASYGYGMGLLHRGGDPDVQTSLTYARIDGQEYGTPLDSLFDIRVGTEPSPLPREPLRLSVYPNPVRSAARIALGLAHPGRVGVRVYDALGRLVAVPLGDAVLPAGRHMVGWDAGAVAPGVYVVRVSADEHPVAQERIVVVR